MTVAAAEVSMLGRRLLDLGEVEEQPLTEHLAVADVAEDARDPGDLLAQPRGPRVVHERGEGLQAAADPPCGHAHLVDRVGLVEAYPAVLLEQGQDVAGEVGAYDLAGRVVGGQPRRVHDVGRRGRQRAEGAPDLGDVPAGYGARGAEPRLHRVEQLGSARVQLDLELAEPRRDVLAVEDRDRVVGQLGEQLARRRRAARARCAAVRSVATGSSVAERVRDRTRSVSSSGGPEPSGPAGSAAPRGSRVPRWAA